MYVRMNVHVSMYVCMYEKTYMSHNVAYVDVIGFPVQPELLYYVVSSYFQCLLLKQQFIKRRLWPECIDAIDD